MVVDDGVRVVVANPRLDAATTQGLGAVAGYAVTGPQEARVAGNVHVQEIAGAGPLVAVGRLLGLSGRPRQPRSPQHLPDGRVAEASGAGDQPRSPAGFAAAGTDRLLEVRCELAWRAVWTTRAVEQAAQRAPSLVRCLCPAMPPAVRRRRRHAEGGRGRLQRQSILDRSHECKATGQSELGVSVQMHPRPPLSVSPGRPTASKEGRISPQPFITCVGGTTSTRAPCVLASQPPARPGDEHGSARPS